MSDGRTRDDLHRGIAKLTAENADLREKLKAAIAAQIRVCDVCGDEEGHGRVMEAVEVCRACFEAIR